MRRALIAGLAALALAGPPHATLAPEGTRRPLSAPQASVLPEDDPGHVRAARAARAAQASRKRASPAEPIEALILRAAARFGVDGGRMVRMARCESGLRPDARSPSGRYLGLFQQDRSYWPTRARRAGLAGASPLDPWANAYVSAWMIRRGGWGAWPVCGRR